MKRPTLPLWTVMDGQCIFGWNIFFSSPFMSHASPCYGSPCKHSALLSVEMKVFINFTLKVGQITWSYVKSICFPDVWVDKWDYWLEPPPWPRCFTKNGLDIKTQWIREERRGEERMAVFFQKTGDCYIPPVLTGMDSKTQKHGVKETGRERRWVGFKMNLGEWQIERGGRTQHPVILRSMKID